MIGCFNPPRSAGSGESLTHAPGGGIRFCFNPPRSAGSGESDQDQFDQYMKLFQSAPERGLRGIARATGSW